MSDMRAVALEDDGFDDPPPYMETTESTQQPNQEIGFNREYLFSVPGALKLVEILLSLIGFVATVAAGYGGGGFVSWVTISAFIATTILFIIQVLNIYARLPGFWPLYEFIYLVLYTLKYLIATIVAGASAVHGASIMAACVICAVACLMYLLDSIMAYKRLQEEKQKRDDMKVSGHSQRGGDSFCIIF